MPVGSFNSAVGEEDYCGGCLTLCMADKLLLLSTSNSPVEDRVHRCVGQTDRIFSVSDDMFLISLSHLAIIPACRSTPPLSSFNLPISLISHLHLSILIPIFPTISPPTFPLSSKCLSSHLISSVHLYSSSITVLQLSQPTQAAVSPPAPHLLTSRP